jgi:hypothetical protein
VRQKPLNLVAGWIDTVTIKRDATLSAHECKRPHAGDDAGLTSEGVRLAALAVESDRQPCAANDIRQEKTVAGCAPVGFERGAAQSAN